jgi:hypothetical protein
MLLLDPTKLPIAEVAARAGFASLRRCSAVLAEVYKRQAGMMAKKKARHAPGLLCDGGVAYFLPVGVDLPSFQI